jgi:hypothetical protein
MPRSAVQLDAACVNVVCISPDTNTLHKAVRTAAASFAPAHLLLPVWDEGHRDNHKGGTGQEHARRAVCSSKGHTGHNWKISKLSHNLSADKVSRLMCTHTSIHFEPCRASKLIKSSVSSTTCACT